MKTQFEALLRPPIEWWTSVTAFAVAIILYDSTWLLSPILLDSLIVALLALATVRAYQGYRVIRYQRNIKKLRHYALSSDELPISDDKLFLGKGFKWEAKHTQRLYQLKQTEFANYLPLAKKTSPAGGNTAIHGIEVSEKDVFMNLSERVGHTMILGTTRVGKTRLLELMIASDIRRNDSAVIVLDPKGDIDLLRRVCHEAKKVNRENDVVIFHLGYANHSARYNPIGNFARITEVANRVANQLPSSGESAAFKEFAWRFVNIIAKAQVALGQKPNYKALDKYILNIDPLLKQYCESWLPSIVPDWKGKVLEEVGKIDEKKLPFHLKGRSRWMIALVRYVDSLKQDNDIYEGLKSIFNYDQTYFQKITASLSPLFAKLTSGRIAELLSPDYDNVDDTRPIFDWMQVIRGKKIVYIGLDALSDSTVSSAVGNSMFADLCSTIGQIYKFGVEDDIANPNKQKQFHKVNVYSDEFNELAGDEFIPLANKGGGAGLQLTVATQTGSDVLARLGNQAKANQVFGNFNTLLSLRVLEESTAKLLTSKLPQRIHVQSIMHSSSANDTTSTEQSFTTHAEDRLVTHDVPLIGTDDVMQLPKGQAFCLLNGGQLWKVRFPLPKEDMVDMPTDVEAIVNELTHPKEEP